MPWPTWWSPSDTRKDDDSASSDLTQHSRVTPGQDLDSSSSSSSTLANASFNSAFTEPQNIIATAVLTSICLGLARVYRGYLHRVPQATDIPQSFFRRRSILGKVTSVGDGDNFRVYHTPGGRLAGWEWLPGRGVPTDRKKLKDNTIHVRIAGIDAPELAHFGRPAQPYSQEALDWLTSYLRGRRVRTFVYKLDQYSRVVGTAYVRKGLFKRDVGLQMIRAGLATVYEAKTGAEFGPGLEKKYRSAEQWAKTKKKGMWSGKAADFESPRQYKTKYKTAEASDHRGPSIS